MTSKVYWDIETGSVDGLFSYGPGYIRLVGYQIDDNEPVVTTDVNALIRVLKEADRHYSFNGLAFDYIALALYHDVDYYEITENAVDLMLVERQVNPPRAKTNYPRGYWGLDATSKRYGHTGKTDDLRKLAAEYGGFDRIPMSILTPYLFGDIATTKFLADKIGPEYETDPYLPEEHETMRRMYYGARLKGYRVDVPELENRLELQRIRKERNFRKLESEYGIPLKVREVTEFKNPFGVSEGKDWFEEQCVGQGIGDLVPRTKTGSVSLTTKGVEKMLSQVTEPDAVDFLSSVLGVMELNPTKKGPNETKEQFLKRFDEFKFQLGFLNDEYGLPLERVEVIESKSPLRTTHGQRALYRYLKSIGMYLPRTKSSTFTLEDGTVLAQFSTTKDDLNAAVALYEDPEELRRRRVKPPSPERLEKFKELVETVIDVTTERTVNSTIRDHLVGDRVYPKITPKQASGRWSVTEPGLTVLGKRGGKHQEREVFLADDEDEVLIAVDLDQVDARAIAGHSQDPEYAKFFEPGKDLHSEVAMIVFGRCDKEFREMAKPLGHGINYGQGPKGAAANANVPLDIAYEFYNNYTRSFPILELWKKGVREQAGLGLLLDNGFGRKMKADPSRAHTQGPALMGQGATRDIMSRWVKRLDLDCVRRIKCVIHDEVVFSVPRARAAEYKERILAAATFDFKGIPITAGCSPEGTNWGACYGGK